MIEGKTARTSMTSTGMIWNPFSVCCEAVVPRGDLAGVVMDALPSPHLSKHSEILSWPASGLLATYSQDPAFVEKRDRCDPWTRLIRAGGLQALAISSGLAPVLRFEPAICNMPARPFANGTASLSATLGPQGTRRRCQQGGFLPPAIYWKQCPRPWRARDACLDIMENKKKTR